MASRRARAVSGTVLKAARIRAGISTSGRGWIHGGVRWNTVEVRSLFGDLRDELDRGRAGPDDRDPPARQVTGVIPAGRVERGALEALRARDVRVGGQVQRARGGHHRPRPVADQFTALDGLDVPAPGVVVPVHPLDRAAVPDVLVQAVLAGAGPQVVPDLLLRCEQVSSSPGSARRSRSRAETARHTRIPDTGCPATSRRDRPPCPGSRSRGNPPSSARSPSRSRRTQRPRSRSLACQDDNPAQHPWPFTSLSAPSLRLRSRPSVVPPVPPPYRPLRPPRVGRPRDLPPATPRRVSFPPPAQPARESHHYRSSFYSNIVLDQQIQW